MRYLVILLSSIMAGMLAIILFPSRLYTIIKNILKKCKVTSSFGANSDNIRRLIDERENLSKKLFAKKKEGNALGNFELSSICEVTDHGEMGASYYYPILDTPKNDKIRVVNREIEALNQSLTKVKNEIQICKIKRIFRWHEWQCCNQAILNRQRKG